MIFRQFWAVLEKLFFHPKKFHNTYKKLYVIHLWLGQHDALCGPNYVWGGPHTMSRPEWSRVIMV